MHDARRRLRILGARAAAQLRAGARRPGRRARRADRAAGRRVRAMGPGTIGQGIAARLEALGRMGFDALVDVAAQSLAEGVRPHLRDVARWVRAVHRLDDAALSAGTLTLWTCDATCRLNTPAGRRPS